jgi:hypothetical protein
VILAKKLEFRQSRPRSFGIFQALLLSKPNTTDLDKVIMTPFMPQSEMYTPIGWRAFLASVNKSHAKRLFNSKLNKLGRRLI